MDSIFQIFGELFVESFATFTSGPILIVYEFLLVTSPLWLPLLLGFIFWFKWIEYVRAKFIANQNHVLLEIKLPPEVFKSPLAMELALANLHLTSGESTWYDKYFLGKVRAWFSLEIASIEGNVHFFIWTREVFKNLVESQLYGQYPNIEIFEVPDYTDNISRFDKEKMSLWANNFILAKPDPYPIKTYIDFGLDRDPKEEFKIDPLTTVIEYLASLGKGEQIWFQILMQAHKKRKKKGTFQETDWKKEGAELVQQLQKEFRKSDDTDKDGNPLFRFPTKSETDTLAAIDRSISKLGYDVGIRLVYFAEKSKFNGGRISALTNLMKPFNSNNLNQFVPSNTTSFDYPFEDFRDIRVNAIKSASLDAYKRRSYFHPPYQTPAFVLNSEELATIFHLPGGVLQTPSVNRVGSRKAEAPVNLPT